MKIYIVGYQSNYANWIPLGLEPKIVDKIEDSDLVLFTGGEDVSPSLYNQSVGNRTFFSPHRDLFEKRMYENALDREIPMLGICRGNQFLSVMNGCTLIQDQSNERFVHDIELFNNKRIKITSSHHQSVFPYDLPPDEYKMIAWTVPEHMSKFHLNGENEDIYTEEYKNGIFKECEMIYFPKTKCFGIQGHPEYSEMHNHFDSLVEVQNLFTQFMEGAL